MYAVMNKHLMTTEPDSQEYLYGQLVGVRNSHLSMFPKIWDMLEKAKELDWDRKIVGPDDSPDASGYEVVNHGSFDGLYEAVIEPWLGKYPELREIVGRYQRGEISVEDGVVQIELGRRGSNQHTRKEDMILSGPPSGKCGTGRAYTEARLRRDRPDLAARVRSGELSANAAAIEAGFRKQATPIQKMLRWVPDLTEDEWQQLVDARNRIHKLASE
jgi:hypothetical protein